MTQPLLGGLHDREGIAVAPPNSWLLDTLAMSESPAPYQYPTTHHWIGRLNWGYGTTGTIPTPNLVDTYIERIVTYVRGSSGCHRWIIGNEPNLPREWPNGMPIMPSYYAEVYRKARAAIKAIPGRANDEVLIAGPGPWNAELTYPGNSAGDWVRYFADVIAHCQDEIDGFAIHSYTHGYNVALVTSSARMDPPFQHRHYEFRAYRDFLKAIPESLEHLPVYLTEANGDGPWQAVGLIPAMLGEIDAWNKTARIQIQCVIFYRYPRYDANAQFAIEGKSDVIHEFLEAVGRYSTPTRSTNVAVPVPPVTQTSVVSFSATPPLPSRLMDPRLTERGVTVEEPALQPGQKYWRAVDLKWLDEQQSQGRHHIYADVQDENGNRLVDAPLVVTWPTGATQIRVEAKPGEPYGANFAMTASRNEFAIRVIGDHPSDIVRGIGMGADTPTGFNAGVHTSTCIVFRLVTVPAQTKPQPQPKPQPTTVPPLAHPVQDPQHRIITQPFGARPEVYSQYNVDGVPLKGHEGVDFGTPTGGRIVAVDDGIVIEAGDQGNTAYGKYIKLIHPWGESVYAHLSQQLVQVRQTVTKGQVIGLSGYSGNVDPPGPAGAHLHFGLRVNPYDRSDGWGGYSDPMPYLNGQAAQPKPVTDLLPLIKAAAAEFGVDWQLLASQAWAESSWRPDAVSGAGAKGLMQIMDATWQEWAPKVGATDPFNARDSLRVGAAYLAWLIKTTGGNPYQALIAYGWGIGNWMSGQPRPDMWVQYANKIVHGADLLKAVGA